MNGLNRGMYFSHDNTKSNLSVNIGLDYKEGYGFNTHLNVKQQTPKADGETPR